MHKYITLFISAFFAITLQAQVTLSDFEKYPVFPDCETVSVSQLPNCFNEKLISFVIDNFEMPAKVEQEQYEGEMVMLFEVTAKGKFKLLYTDAIYNELKEEAQKIFDKLPDVAPATYNAEPTYIQFSMPVKIPLSQNSIADFNSTTTKDVVSAEDNTEENPLKQEYDKIQNQEFERKNKFNSQLNIPFSHQIYSRFDKQLNMVGTNSHTGSKPFLYDVVDPYYNFEEKEDALLKEKNTWLGRKWSNEHMVQLQGDDYWITIDPAADLQLGVESDDDKEESFTYNNTRARICTGRDWKKTQFFCSRI